jgi:hypothetical protein
MLTEVVVATATGLTGGYGLLTGMVALIASAHPDEKRRADAAKVLDRLLRRARR